MRCAIISALVLLAPFSIMAEDSSVIYELDGKAYEGYYLSPSPQAPLVLLIHDWDGLTDYEVKRAHMLADMGYAVFAADLFGAGVRPIEMKERQRLTGELYGDREKMRALLLDALQAAQSRGANIHNAVAMGYCFGGTAALELARSGADLKGFVAFHGGLSTPEGQDYSRTRGKLLILHGTADESITMDDFAKLARELEEQGVAHEMIAYSGAPHAFTVFGSDRYREDADRKSWKRFQQFLAETLESKQAIADDAGPAAGKLYVCERGDSLRVDPVGDWEAVVLYLDGDVYLLPQVVSASGAKYSDGQRTFWTKGEEAFLEVDGVIVKKACRPILSTAGGSEIARQAFELPVVSHVSLDVAAFNDRLEIAWHEGEGWTHSALRIALEYLDDLEGRLVGIIKVDEPTESPVSSVVTVVREGLLDDSVRAVWDQVHLARAEDGQWRLVRSYRAYRCWRANQQKSFSSEPCS